MQLPLYLSLSANEQIYVHWIIVSFGVVVVNIALGIERDPCQPYSLSR